MTLFNTTEPIIRRKQRALDFQDRQGLLKLKLKIVNKTIFSSIYTRIDQVFVLWGIITAIIFFTAQFVPINWVTQAILWSMLTAIGTLGMTILTYFWVTVERLRWILYGWASLMLVGIIVTDLGIIQGWPAVLANLCSFWLGLSALGYICTGLGLQSRAFIVAAIAHMLGIFILPYCIGWQFLVTGFVMTTNLIFFAETQWDMRPPIGNYDLLSKEQQDFNRKQYLTRQVESA